MVDGVGGANPATYYVHADHLHRPMRMTNAAKSIVWSAEYQPWGAVQSLSGPLTLDLRFPGQWFQLEAGLHYNWHRHYDASLGRYTQPDPLGFVDGPSLFGYAGGSPLNVDPEGPQSSAITKIPGITTICTLGFVEPTPLGEIACACAIAAAAMMTQSKPDPCQQNSCMASRGNVADTQIVNDWSQVHNQHPDKCKWLEQNKDKYRPDQVKATQKAWGCRPSRESKDKKN